jgi:hypothetical protein
VSVTYSGSLLVHTGYTANTGRLRATEVWLTTSIFAQVSIDVARLVLTSEFSSIRANQTAGSQLILKVVNVTIKTRIEASKARAQGDNPSPSLYYVPYFILRQWHFSDVDQFRLQRNKNALTYHVKFRIALITAVRMAAVLPQK